MPMTETERLGLKQYLLDRAGGAGEWDPEDLSPAQEEALQARAPLQPMEAAPAAAPVAEPEPMEGLELAKPASYLEALDKARRADAFMAMAGGLSQAIGNVGNVVSRGLYRPQQPMQLPSEVSALKDKRAAVMDYLRQQREAQSAGLDADYKRALTGAARALETQRNTPPVPKPPPPVREDPLLDDKRVKLQNEADAAAALAEARRRQGQPKPGKPADTGPKLNKAAETLRKEFNGLPVVKDYNDVAAAYGKMKKAAESPSAAGDLSLIFGYMKMLDPGSTVREGEFANAQNAGGIDDKLASTYNRVLNGQRLTEDQRRDFIGRARQLFDTHAEQLNAAAERYTGIAKKSGADPEDVVIRPPSEGMAPDRKARLQELRAKKAAGTLGGP